MNCAYHSHNGATVNCNGCGKALCPACDHRIKGFPYCQDCIVSGIDLLRQQSHSNYAPYVQKRSSPFLASLLSFICPGLGAAYNGQSTKALVHFAVFVGLFQMAVLTGTPLFVLGFMGMWAFALVDSWRTAQAIRSGVTPDVAEDLLVKRFAGNPKLWGVVLVVLGATFVFQRLFNFGGFMRMFLPVLLIGLGAWILRGYIFRQKDVSTENGSTSFALATPEVRQASYELDQDFATRSRFGNWREK
jgi:hypothetical protein